VARKPTDTVKLQLRLSERLRRRLEQAAKHNKSSMNTEIVSRLDSSFQREEQEEMNRRRRQEQEEMIRRATVEAVKASAGQVMQMIRSELHLLPQQPPGKPQLSDDESARLSTDKEDKSK
jgi:Arc-like DNA binding domain